MISHEAEAGRHRLRDMATAVRAVHSLAEQLDELIGGRDCILLDFPDYDNIGDHLIWLGTKIILKDILGLDVVYQCSYHNIDYAQIKRRKDAVILCAGGGNFGDLYKPHQNMREEVVEKFPSREIIFLPQTIFFDDEGNLNASATRLSAGKRLSIFARDHQSQAIAQRFALPGRTHLGIDTAFALTYLMPRLLNEVGVWTGRPVFLVRKDRESALRNQIHNPRALILDWQDHDLLEAETLNDTEVKDVIYGLGLDRIIDNDWEAKSLGYLVRACALFGSASYIVTDRLHGHILSLLLGKKHYVLDNSYGKNTNFIDAWTRDDILVDVVNGTPLTE